MPPRIPLETRSIGRSITVGQRFRKGYRSKRVLEKKHSRHGTKKGLRTASVGFEGAPEDGAPRRVRADPGEGKCLKKCIASLPAAHPPTGFEPGADMRKKTISRDGCDLCGRTEMPRDSVVFGSLSRRFGDAVRKVERATGTPLGVSINPWKTRRFSEVSENLFQPLSCRDRGSRGRAGGLFDDCGEPDRSRKAVFRAWRLCRLLAVRPGPSPRCGSMFRVGKRGRCAKKKGLMQGTRRVRATNRRSPGEASMGLRAGSTRGESETDGARGSPREERSGCDRALEGALRGSKGR